MIIREKPARFTFGPLAELGPTVSPDGQWIAFEYFERRDSSNIQIWSMPSTGPFSRARPLVNDGKYHAGVSWAQDSKSIAYVTHEADDPNSSLTTSQIDKTDIFSRQTVRLTRLPKGAAVGDFTSWSKDGKIAFELDDELYAIRDSGGEPFQLIQLQAKQAIVRLSPAAPIAWSPDSKKVAFVAENDSNSVDGTSVWIADLSQGALTLVLKNQHVCCISWPYPHKLLLSKVSEDGSSRVGFLSLEDSKFEPVTDGPLDLWAGSIKGYVKRKTSLLCT